MGTFVSIPGVLCLGVAKVVELRTHACPVLMPRGLEEDLYLQLACFSISKMAISNHLISRVTGHETSLRGSCRELGRVECGSHLKGLYMGADGHTPDTEQHPQVCLA